jgi:hypothetical protein
MSWASKPSMSWAFIGIFIVVFSLSFCPKIWKDHEINFPANPEHFVLTLFTLQPNKLLSSIMMDELDLALDLLPCQGQCNTFAGFILRTI